MAPSIGEAMGQLFSMIADFLKHPAAAGRHYDVAVIGAGPAGITIARELMRRGHDICLVESGGLDFDSRTQALYAGRNIGQEYYDLDQSRLRFFGGTAAIWGGRCAVLDEIDFRRRNWVPHSGWPITRKELMPWYRKAQDIFEIGEFAWDNAYELCGIPDQDFDPEKFTTGLWRFDVARERFGASNAGDLKAASNLTLLLHANAVRIQLINNGSAVDHIALKAIDGPSAQLKATHYVIACGAIENIRLLMSSSDVMPNGIGNDYDQLGRFFMEHPNGRIGKVEIAQPFRLWSTHQKRFMKMGPPLAPVLRLADTLQEAEETLNSIATFKLQRPPQKGVPLGNKLYHHIKHSMSPNRTARALNHNYRQIRAWFHRVARTQVEMAMANAGMTKLFLMIRGEQAPNPESRVVLSDRRDELGQQGADLSWQLSALDKHTARVFARVFNDEASRLYDGFVVPSEWLSELGHAWPVDPTVGNHPIAGYHHMGGTRMSDDPKRGVVDPHCGVHGTNNLHIAGSSVFCTAGWANPTFTITALALRLADKLDRTIGCR
ncbi:FAD-dependent oxidoreductase [Sphingopyxis indica]|nr:GMC family oxidoreductase [Sphingopyxis indica]